MDQEPKVLQIVQLEAQNVTNLRAIKITPEGKAVVLTGANEAGKSNVLDIIKTMLEGLKLKMPIKDGEERGEAFLNLGDIKISKVWTSKGERLEVYKELPDGKKLLYSSPQTFLNELTGKMVDPMKLYATMNNNPREFRNVLAKLVGLDITDLETEKAEVFEDRKAINSRIRDSIAQLKDVEAPDPETPSDELTFKEELDKVSQLRGKRETYTKVVQHKADLENAIEVTAMAIESKKEEAIKLQESIEALEDSKRLTAKDINELVLPEAVSQEQIIAAESDIEGIESKNVAIRAANRYRKYVKEAEKQKVEADKLTQKLERIEQDKATRIANCQFPVPELALTDDLVTYQGKPLDMASDGRKIRVFTKIAMAMSPNVKVLLIKDGSLLDSQGFKEVCEMAGKEGYQIWMEKVDETGKVGIFIENGEITAIDGTPTEKPEAAEKAEGQDKEQPAEAPEA